MKQERRVKAKYNRKQTWLLSSLAGRAGRRPRMATTQSPTRCSASCGRPHTGAEGPLTIRIAVAWPRVHPITSIRASPQIIVQMQKTTRATVATVSQPIPRQQQLKVIIITTASPCRKRARRRTRLTSTIVGATWEPPQSLLLPRALWASIPEHHASRTITQRRRDQLQRSPQAVGAPTPASLDLVTWPRSHLLRLKQEVHP